ncbi:Crp/Fnr family transcriptional regulator [Parenemella sanctibonifatiensis]|uniref:Crp/Fnr family transcriptional regulator n=1 Tax=Parenemella sanctibonifatiensis TaxID=2016505 RepID=A0A255ENV3_9ACTN|nr:Crp/Fnr family transcriptional regulator [Parenemella sanctibonifatiensis]OYN84577.1 Crp/Fnr family transcriptional regulator [Parenemella sanctibonifatiensis]OYN92651.1 Crp/Fnr family transcriptional regulator [Parenemella sanctibonifatiensis]
MTHAASEPTWRDAPLFEGADESTIDAVGEAMSTVNVRRGETLFRAGDRGTELYIITAGRMKLSRIEPNPGPRAPRETLLSVLTPGQMFGELSLFDPGPRNTTATALLDTQLRCLEHDDLLELLNGRPEISRALLTRLAHRLRRANEIAIDLVLSDVPGRVAKSLLRLAEKFAGDQPLHAPIEVRHDLTQAEIAHMAGASRETVNKVLVDFAVRGWIRLESGAFTILDHDRLVKRSS